MNIYKDFNLNYRHRRLLLLVRKSLEAKENTLVGLSLLDVSNKYPRYINEAIELGYVFENFSAFSEKFHRNASLKELLFYKITWVDSLTSYLNTIHRNAVKTIKEIK